ncbi:MAG: TraR/DksA family transcriptional regulator [Anaerolineae bacterium]
MMNTSIAQKVETLIGQRNDVLEEIEHLRLALSAEVDPAEDEADPEIVEREKTLAVLRAFERKLDEIDLALRAAEAGSYGICEVCGQPIDPARLKIVPEATMCVRCKTATEQRIRR